MASRGFSKSKAVDAMVASNDAMPLTGEVKSPLSSLCLSMTLILHPSAPLTVDIRSMTTSVWVFSATETPTVS